MIVLKDFWLLFFNSKEERHDFINILLQYIKEDLDTRNVNLISEVCILYLFLGTCTRMQVKTYLIFHKLSNIIIFCRQFYGANELLLRYIFQKDTKNFQITPSNTKNLSNKQLTLLNNTIYFGLRPYWIRAFKRSMLLFNFWCLPNVVIECGCFKDAGYLLNFLKKWKRSIPVWGKKLCTWLK